MVQSMRINAPELSGLVLIPVFDLLDTRYPGSKREHSLQLIKT